MKPTPSLSKDLRLLTMKFRAKAPLRLGLAGGGTDVSPYSDQHGGMVLNAAINKYAYCIIEPLEDGSVAFEAADQGKRVQLDSAGNFELAGELILHKAVYNAVARLHGRPLSFRMITYSDAPAGSGLGTSSTLVVAMLTCFTEWLKLPLGEYDTAHLAYRIERVDAGLHGGKQDQYAATFGGFNFIEFYSENRVIVNPLRVKSSIINELEASMVLYYTGQSRLSHKIIEEQIRNAAKNEGTPLEAMHKLKSDAVLMKECLLKGDIKRMATVLGTSWEAKRLISSAISSSAIEEIFEGARRNGAMSGKLSGAGGGGYIFFMVDPVRRHELIRFLKGFGGIVDNFGFTSQGAESWTISRPTPEIGLSHA